MLLPLLLLAAIPPTISEESKVPPYTLPDPLVCADGRKVTDAKTWSEVRRPEVFRLVEENMFGRTPDTSKLQADAVVEVREQSKDAFGGKATRTQFKVWPIGKKGPSFDMLLYVPNAAKRPAPVFVGLNFGSNHTTTEDPAVFVASTLRVTAQGSPAPMVSARAISATPRAATRPTRSATWLPFSGARMWGGMSGESGRAGPAASGEAGGAARL